MVGNGRRVARANAPLVGRLWLRDVREVVLVAGEVVLGGRRGLVRLKEQEAGRVVLPARRVLTARIWADADVAGVEVRADVVAADRRDRPAAHLDAVLRDEVDLSEPGDRVPGDGRRRAVAVHDDAALLIRGDAVAADVARGADRGTESWYERDEIDPDPMLRSVERVVADVVHVAAGHVDGRSVSDDTEVARAVDRGSRDVAGAPGRVVDAHVATCRVKIAADVAADLRGGEEHVVALEGRRRAPGGLRRWRGDERQYQRNAGDDDQCFTHASPLFHSGLSAAHQAEGSSRCDPSSLARPFDGDLAAPRRRARARTL